MTRTPPPPKRRSARRPRPTLGTTLELDPSAPDVRGGVPNAASGNKIEPAPPGLLCIVGSCIGRRRPAEVTVVHLGIGGRVKWPYCSYHAWPYRPRTAG